MEIIAHDKERDMEKVKEKSLKLTVTEKDGEPIRIDADVSNLNPVEIIKLCSNMISQTTNNIKIKEDTIVKPNLQDITNLNSIKQ